MTEEVLTLHFREPVDVSSYEPTAVTLQAAFDAPVDRKHTLKFGDVVEGSVDHTTVVIKLELDDLNELKRKVIGANKGTTYLALTEDAIKDQNGEKVNPLQSSISALLVANYNEDITPPVLNGYDLDMTQQILTLSFSETVDVGTVDVETFTFLHGQDGSASPYTLTTSQTTTPNGPTVIIRLSLIDLNNIKRIDTLATGVSDTYLRLTQTIAGNVPVRDMNAIAFVDLSPAEAIQVNTIGYNPDGTSPVLEKFALNMATGILTMDFSETIDRSTLKTEFIAFQGAAILTNSVQKYPLGSAYRMISTQDDPTVIIELSHDDMNAIKKLRLLARDESTTFLVIDSPAVQDMTNVNYVVADGVEITDAAKDVALTDFQVDNIDPKMVSFTLDMTEGELTMSFDETVKAENFVIGALTLQTAETSTGVDYTLFESVLTPANDDSTELRVKLTKVEMDEIKRLQICTTYEGDCYVRFTKFLVTDMEDRAIVKVADGKAMPVKTGGYTRDRISPTVIGYAVDMSTNLISVTFSETILVSSIDYLEIRAQNAPLLPSTDGFAFTDGAMQTLDGLVATFEMVFQDTESLKLTVPNLYREQANAYLQMSEDSITDMAGNKLNTFVPQTPADPFKGDIVSPKIVGFGLDMDKGVLSLEFDESVAVVSETIPINTITFTEPTSTVSRTLAGGDLLLAQTDVANNRGRFLVFQLTTPDIQYLKSEASIATDASNVLLTATSSFILDLSENPLDSVDGMAVTPSSAFAPDLTKPELVRFEELDLTVGVMTLLFNEPVDINNFDPTGIVLVSSDESEFVKHTVIDAEIEISIDIDVAAGDIPKSKVNIKLSDADRLQIALMDDLYVSRGSSFVLLTDGAIADMQGNAIADTDVEQVRLNRYTADSRKPDYAGFELDLNDGFLTLTFTTPINPETLDTTQLTIQSHASQEHSDAKMFTFTTKDESDSSIGYIAVIKLSVENLNGIKELPTLAISEESTFISYQPEVIYGLNGNLAEVVPKTAGEQVDENGFDEDDVNAVLSSFTLDLTEEELIMYFTETIRYDTFEVSNILISNSDSSSAFDFTSDSTLVHDPSAFGSEKLVVSIGHADMNRLKFNRNVGNERANTYLQTNPLAGYIGYDMNSNDIEWPFMASTETLPDTTAPTLDSFDLDMNTGILVLHFSETVDFLVFKETEISIQSAFATEFATSIPLTTAASVSLDAVDVISVTINVDDMNALKAKEFARADTEIFVNIAPSAVTDIGSEVRSANAVAASVLPNAASGGIGLGEYKADVRSPEATGYTLNMNDNELKITFDETIDPTCAGTSSACQKVAFDGISLSSYSTVTTYACYEIATVSVLSDKTMCESSSNADQSTCESHFTAASQATPDCITGFVPGTSASNPSTTCPTGCILNSEESSDEGSASGSGSGDGYSETCTAAPTNDVVACTWIGTDEEVVEESHRLSSSTGVESGMTTVITATVTELDMHAIKLLTTLAVDSHETRLVIDAGAVSDVAAAPNQIKASTASGVVTVDVTPPSLDTFAVDLDQGILTFNFDEPIDFEAFDPTKITLISNKDVDPSQKVLTGGLVLTPSGLQQRLKLDKDDLNDIFRFEDLFISKESSLIRFDRGMVTDMNGVDIEPIANGETMEASAFSIDNTQPELEAYSIDMSSGDVVLTFTETVDVATIDFTAIVLQSSSAVVGESEKHNLIMDSVDIAHGDDPEVSFTLTHEDMNILKAKEIALTEGTAWLAMSDVIIYDKADKPVVIREAGSTALGPRVGGYLPDTVKPEVEGFELDMSEGVMSISFSETVRLSQFAGASISLRLVGGALATTLQGTLKSTLPSDLAELQIPVDVLNDIKADRRIATESSDTVATFAATTVVDMSGMPLVLLENNNDLAAHVEDDVNPTLQAFFLDVDDSRLYLSFDETIEEDSLVVSGITIVASTFADSAEERVPLTSSSVIVNEGDDTHIVVALSITDMNAIKKNTVVAFDKGSSHVILAANTVQDMNAKPILEIPIANAVGPASVYEVDGTAPILESWSINMNDGTIVLTFDETVKASTLSPPSLTLWSSATNDISAESHVLSGQVKPDTAEDSTELTINLSHYHLNELRRKKICSPRNVVNGVSTDCALAWTSTLVDDMSTESNDVVNSLGTLKMIDVALTALPVSGWVPDDTDPKLLTSKLDLTAETLTLSFDEVVLAESLDVTTIRLQTVADYSASKLLTFKLEVTTTLAGNSRSGIEFQVYDDTANQVPLNARAYEWHNEALNTVQTVDVPLVLESGSTVTVSNGAITGSSVQVGFRVDATSPGAFTGSKIAFDNFHSDGTRTGTASFSSEDGGAVKKEYFEVGGSSYERDLSDDLVLLNAREAVSLSYDPDGLPIHSATLSADGEEIVVQLGSLDLNRIKKLENLAITQESSWVVISVDTIVDMHGNPVEEVPTDQAQNVVSYKEDETDPEVIEFTLDMDAGMVLLTFSEVVAVATPFDDLTSAEFDVEAIKFQSSAEFNSLTTTSYPLKSSAVLIDESDVVLTIKLNSACLNDLKLLEEVGVDDATSFLTLATSLVKDMNGNLVAEIPVDDALPVGTYIPDTTPPELLSFTFNMNTGMLHLQFDEAVLVSSLVVSGLVIEDSTGSSSLPLEVGSAALALPTNAEDVFIRLPQGTDVYEMNALKFDRNVATEESNTYVKVLQTAIKDMTNTNAVVPTKMKVVDDGFTKDTTDPKLVDAALDMDAGKLYLTFDETIDVATFTPQFLALFSKNPSGQVLDAFPLTDDSTIASDHLNSVVAVVDIGLLDRNAIKFKTDLCVDKDSCFVAVQPDCISDMNSQTVASVEPDSGVPITTFTMDKTPPVLLNVGLNLNANVLSLTFDETVDVETLDVSKIAIYNVFTSVGLTKSADTTTIRDSPTTTVSVPKGSATASIDGTIIVIALSVHDTNRLARDLDVAKTDVDTYVSLQTEAIFDMNAIAVAEVNMGHSDDLDFQADDTAPVLQWFTVDMTTGTLELYFDETVRLDDFNIDRADVLDSSKKIAHALSKGATTAGAFLDAEGVLLTVTLEDNDLDIIKANRDMFTSADGSIISFDGTMIKDNNGNAIEANDGNVPCLGFKDDGNAPVLRSFEVDLSRNVLTLSFSETVDVSTFTATHFVLQAYSGDGDALLRRRLVSTSAPVDDDTDWTTFEVQLGPEDTHAIKENIGFGTTVGDTYLRIDSDEAILDMNNNRVDLEAGLKANEVKSDEVDPSLTHFDLDMSTGLLVLHFDEPVNAASFLPELVVLAGKGAGDTTLRLDRTNVHSRGALTQAHKITIDLNTTPDLDELKFFTDIAVSPETTNIILDVGCVKDTSLNPSNAFAKAAVSVNAGVYQDDQTHPELESFDLNMDTGILVLSFDEVILMNSIDEPEFTIVSAAQEFKLTRNSYRTTTTNGLVAEIQIGWEDLNALKLLQQLATGETADDDTRIIFTSDACTDMNGKALVAHADRSSAIDMGAFVPDDTAPYMTGFTLDMNVGIQATLTMTFSEPVLASSLDMAELAITGSGAEGATAHFPTPGVGSTLSSSPVDNSANGITLTITLGSDFVNGLKQDRTAATAVETTFVAFSELTVKDMNDNMVLATTVSDYGVQMPHQHPCVRDCETAEITKEYEEDLTRPTITGTFIDLREDGNHEIRITFDETVDLTDGNIAFSLLEIGGFELSGGVTPESKDDTELIFSFTAGDDNTQKIDEVLHDIDATIFAISDSFVHDMNNNNINGVSVTVTNAARETRMPSLVEFRVDMDGAQLFLIFDEPVRANTMVITKLSVQSAAVDLSPAAPFAKESLTAGSTTLSENGLEIIVDVSRDDLNRIKTDTALLSLLENSFVALEAGFIQDMAQDQNPSVEVVKQAVAFDEDITSPRLDYFNLNMHDGILTLHFLEVVSMESVKTTEITLQNTPSTDGLEIRTLTGGEKTSDEVDADGTAVDHVRTIMIALTALDMNNMKFKGIGSSRSSSWLTMTASTLVDANDRPVKQIDFAKQVDVAGFVVDGKPPVLESYTLSMDDGELSLTFDETVNPSTIVATAFTFYGGDFSMQVYGGGTTDAKTYTLTDGSGVVDAKLDNTVVVVQLSSKDMNEIKLRDGLAIDEETTLLTINGEGDASDLIGAKDMLGNMIQPLVGKVAAVLTEDTSRPSMTGFELDLTENTITLTFDETIFETPVLDAITFQNTKVATVVDTTHFSGMTAAQSVTLATFDSVTRSDDGLVLTIVANNDDLNNIKYHRELGITQGTTFISITSAAFKDMNNNDVVDIIPSAAKMAAKFVSDKVDPTLDSFDVDLTAETLTLYFSETVESDDLVPTTITFFSGATPLDEQNFVLNAHSITGTDDAATIVVDLHTKDLNDIKYLTNLATSDANLKIDVTTNTIKDMNNRALEAVQLPVSKFKEDTTEPKLVSFDLNMDSRDPETGEPTETAGTLSLTFDETVESSTLNVDQITLQSHRNMATNGATEYTLTARRSTSKSDDSNVIVVNLGFTDLNAIKFDRNLASDTRSTYLRLTASAIKDMNNNDVVNILGDDAMQVEVVDGYSADTTSPSLVDFDVDMDTGLVRLEFDETVSWMTLVHKNLEFMASDGNAVVVASGEVARHHLTSTLAEMFPLGLIISQSDDTDITFQLTTFDLNELKRKEICFDDVSSCFLRMDEGAITDMSVLNPNKNGDMDDETKVQVGVYGSDTVEPELLNFEVDMDLMTLTLSFSEPVFTAELNFDQITMQNFMDTEDEVKLTGGTTDNLNNQVVVVHFSREDSNAIKLNKGLCTGQNNAWITITESTVKDLATVPNSLVPIVDSKTSSKSAAKFTEDRTSPALERFDLDLTAHTLTLSFSETVNAKSLDVTQIVIYGPNSDDAVQLTGSGRAAAFRAAPSHAYKSSPELNSANADPTEKNGAVVVVSLGFADANNLKIRPGMATSASDTYLSMSNFVIQDMFLDSNDDGNQNAPVTKMQLFESGGSFKADEVNPVLERFSLSLDSAMLSLTFSEIVSKSSIAVDKIVLQSEIDGGDDFELTSASALHEFVQYVAPNGILTIDPSRAVDNDYIVDVKLGRADINRLTVIDTLGDATDNTHIAVALGTVQDMNGKQVDEITPGAALAAHEIFADETKPSLLDFDVDMEKGTLYMRMSESVDISTLNANAMTITNGYLSVEAEFESHTFTADSVDYTAGSVVASGPSHSESKNGAEFVVKIGRKDLNELKRLTDTATSAANTVLVFEAPFIKDMYGNDVELWEPHAAEPAVNYTPDTSAPTLTTYDIDLDNGLLYLDFDETIQLSSFTAADAITLHSETLRGSGVEVTLSSDSTLVSDALSPDSALLTVALSTLDLWRIKNQPTLLATSTSGYATLVPNTVSDMVGKGCTGQGCLSANVALELTAQNREVVHDTVSPILQNFKVDLVSGTIALSFDEPVNPTSVNMGGARFQAAKIGTPTLPKRLLSAGTGVTQSTGTLLTVSLTQDDMTSLQQDLSLLHSVDDTFLAFDDSILDDMAVPPNDVQAVSATDSMPASDYLYYDYATVSNIGPDSGNPDGGTPVVITGSGFVQKDLRDTSRTPNAPLPVAVFVNGVEATNVVVKSDTELSFVTPPLGDMTVKTLELEVDVLIDNALTTTAMGFTYLEPPKLTQIRPIAGALSGGTRVTMMGTSFGQDESTGSMSYVRAFFGDIGSENEATDCTVVNGNAICSTPANGDSCDAGWPTDGSKCSVHVTIDIDGSRSTLDLAFEYLPRPTLLAMTPTSGYFNEETAVTVFGNHFGALSATLDGPPLRLLVGDRSCKDVQVVAPTSADLALFNLPETTEMFTCNIAKGHGPGKVFVEIGTITSLEDHTFTDYNDAGQFTFDKVTHYAHESENTIVISVSRSESDHPSPAVLTIMPRGFTDDDLNTPGISQVLSGGSYYKDADATGTTFSRPPLSGFVDPGDGTGYHDGGNMTVSFAENEFQKDFTFTFAAKARVEMNNDGKRGGFASDAAILLDIVDIAADHGAVYSAGAPATVVVEAECEVLGFYCGSATTFNLARLTDASQPMFITSFSRLYYSCWEPVDNQSTDYECYDQESDLGSGSGSED
jgi:hypothetical protein